MSGTRPSSLASVVGMLLTVAVCAFGCYALLGIDMQSEQRRIQIQKVERSVSPDGVIVIVDFEGGSATFHYPVGREIPPICTGTVCNVKVTNSRDGLRYHGLTVTSDNGN